MYKIIKQFIVIVLHVYRSEINLGVERSGFTLVRFHKGIQEHDPYVRVRIIIIVIIIYMIH